MGDYDGGTEELAMTDPYVPPKAGEPPLGSPEAATSGGPYEFTEQENVTIARAAKLARLWGVLALVLGGAMLLMMVGGVFGTVALGATMDEPAAVVILALVVAALTAPMAFVFLATGRGYIASGRAFDQVVKTTGSDVPLLMTALDQLARAFRVEMMVLIGTIVLMVLLQIASLVLDAVGGTIGG